MDTPPNPPDHTEAIKQAVFAGRKIEAIKLYREQHKVELVEAKNAIEDLTSALRASTPEQFTTPAAAAKTGCFSLIILVVGLAGTALWKVVA